MADESTTITGLEPNDDGQEPKPGEEHGSDPKTFDASYVKELRAEAAKYRTELKTLKSEDDKRKADAETADEERLREQQNWQELAEKHEGKVTEVTAELTASAAQVERLTTALATYLEKEMETVPEHLQPLLEKLDVVDRLAYLSENRDALSPKKPNGVPPSPEAGQTPAISEEDRRKRAFAIRL